MCGSVMHFSACFCGDDIFVRSFDCKDLCQLQTLLKTFSYPLLKTFSYPLLKTFSYPLLKTFSDPLLKTFSYPLLCVCSNSDYFYIHSAL